MSNARLWPCTNVEYHADTTAISHSGLDLIIDDPQLYWWQKLSGEYVREEKKEFDEGTALHDALLRPGKCGDGVVVIPKEVLSASGAKAGGKWKEFEAANAGKVLCKADDTLLRMVRAVKAHPAAVNLLEADGTFEGAATIAWLDEEFGVGRKARLDMLHHGSEIIVDLKTTRTPATLLDCANECEKWGYHRQVAYYIDAVEALNEGRELDLHFFFIFVSKIPPYRVEVFELDAEDIAIGAEENAEGLKTYAECLRTNNWLPKTHGKIHKLSLPRRSRWTKQWSA